MSMLKPMLEVCCGSLSSALRAVEGGAERIELCSALSLDGLTPTVGTIRLLRERFPQLRIHVLIRPREGDFVYTEDELQVMETDIREAVAAGATAIVAGALTPSGEIDEAATRRLIAASSGLPFTFHRAFDVVGDQTIALQRLIDLGVTRVLTSGGAPTAEAGIAQLQCLVRQAAGRIVILAGGGVNRHNASAILKETGTTEVHGSCSATLPNGLRETSADEVRAVLSAING